MFFACIYSFSSSKQQVYCRWLMIHPLHLRLNLCAIISASKPKFLQACIPQNTSYNPQVFLPLLEKSYNVTPLPLLQITILIGGKGAIPTFYKVIIFFLFLPCIWTYLFLQQYLTHWRCFETILRWRGSFTFGYFHRLNIFTYQIIAHGFNRGLFL